MTRFTDGPAEGTTLMLHRAPMFLRAVCGSDGKWDALDQLSDSPRSDERIVVYRMVGDPTWMHVRAAKGGGFFRGGEYRVVDPPPADERIRSTVRWREWVGEQVGQPIGNDGGIVPAKAAQ